ncbi:efflux transporter outer membrane subunit [Paracoccus sp. PARArs4]|uniref:efflux transporter outer membrane subunit n=1 Tax=Paracoccus sp. PARArs4 TaxID=2853442 RepID=UPI0024A6E931|nr:efflux transporter outer membrane subunit [Paracoccus sp. PARArs4]
MTVRAIPKRAALSLTALLLISACAAVGPEPTAIPDPKVQPAFEEGDNTPVGQVGARAFWSDYRDPVLSDLIAQGLTNSLDILTANERIRAAQADAQATRPWASQVSGSDATVTRSKSGGDATATSYSTDSSLSASFVFDLFGGARREREAAQSALDAAEAEAEVVRLAWLAEVIAAYADARYQQQALALTRETISARERTLSVTREMQSLGLATDYDIAQTEALLQTARADLPSYEAQFNAQVFRLSTLLNVQARPLMARMSSGSGALRIPAGPGTGVPAELLQNRPDIRQSRAELGQALAQVGVATADMLPSISLTGSVSDSDGTDGWSFGPRVSLPITNQGVLNATRNRRISEAQQADLEWRSDVAAAVEDVQTSQSNLRRYRQRVSTLEGAASSYDRAYDLARQNFEAGALPLVDLLDADRQRASARLSAASARNDAAQEWAVLQIATGAGAAVTRIAE